MRGRWSVPSHGKKSLHCLCFRYPREVADGRDDRLGRGGHGRRGLLYFVKGQSAAVPVEGSFGALLEKDGGVPPFKQLFKYAAELGDAKLLPCSMAIDLLKVSTDQLDPELGPPTGLTKFLSEAEGAQMLTF